MPTPKEVAGLKNCSGYITNFAALAGRFVGPEVRFVALKERYFAGSMFLSSFLLTFLLRVQSDWKSGSGVALKFFAFP
ncbi:hypothetical protein XNC3_1220010 [Xenorhabdus nematophila F1]|nr:hypothetical protein XNC3_1220010 [Xenorhabdus nematophila F1]